jgi:two-component system cell cycle sensor histidine kinase/response regulator CckA
MLAVPAATLVALIVQYELLPHPSNAPFVFLFLAVAVAAWLAGTVAGLVTVAVSVAVGHYVFLARNTAATLVHYRQIAEVLFVVSASGIALLCGSLHSAMLHAEASAKQARENESRYRSLIDNMQEGLALCRMRFRDGAPEDFVYLAVNPAFERLTGLKNVTGRWVTDVIPGIREELFDIYGRVAASGKPETFEMHLNSLKMWFNVSVYSPKLAHFAAIFDVITERKMLEEQLRQSQKMEAMGRLAGGVAHDFNNLLTGIMGNLSLAMLEVRERDELFSYLSEANRAAESAANVTRQLLAFSRKQIVEPRVFDLNEVIQSMNNMLSRLIGDDIILNSSPATMLSSVKLDPGQLEQILVNLAVNAKDAMPNGGRLTLETANVTLDEHYCHTHPEVAPGRYVMLAVSDNGCGMPLEVSCRCLEPFFTTKTLAGGTGLGLSTVYGIVKQARGSIEIYSEVGRGTTVKVYLPRVDEHAEEFSLPAPGQVAPGGTETVLLVEDDLGVRNVALRTLRRLGYHVLHARDGNHAVEVARSYPDEIHLLLTDVVMPHMNGRQLADELCALRPTLRVLFTSGYTDNVIAHHGVLDRGLNFISKPYATQSLAERVRQVLDEHPADDKSSVA